MTNNDTISFRSSTHGIFTVKADHLAMTTDAHSGWTTEALISKVQGLVGEFDYTDLRQVEALILISYLTGGIAD